MMKNKSTLAKLLAEEDIFVVHKKMNTAYFNSKSRELGLPIWKDEEMTPDIYDLMVCHEIAHALWTPLDMLEKAQIRKINHSFVNIVEDARIERMVQNKYPGSVAVFSRGYCDLSAKDFFGIGDKDVSKLNLIDRINLFFKKQKVEFSDDEKVWVKRVAETKTPDDVLNLAEELYAWMAENAPEEKEENPGEENEKSPADPNDESSEETGENGVPADENEKGETLDKWGVPTGGETGEPSEENGEDAPTDDAADDDATDDTDNDKAEEGESSEVGGTDSTNHGSVPKAKTDTDANNAIQKLVDQHAGERTYARIPALNEDLIMPFGEILEKVLPNYAGDNFWVARMKAEVATMKNESKKTVGYMVKEFEMKKAADQYARAAVSKSGSLDMGRLHTYKYNEDIFKKVTTLPGATNHGMVMVVDWSGSMSDNLSGTLSQLFNLIWFCRRTQIPFEVFAFSDNGSLFTEEDSTFAQRVRARKFEPGSKHFKAGDLALKKFKLLNFFSSKMSAKEEMEMMEILWMIVGSWKDRYSYGNNTVECPEFLHLGGTPLNDAIIAMMEIVPKFKRDTGVQKVNTIFLTDGASSRLTGVYDYGLNKDTGEHFERIIPLRGDIIVSDPKTLKNYEIDGCFDMTDGLLRMFKNRVDDMNLIGFFIAGSGRSGRVDKNTLYYLQRDLGMEAIMEQVKLINKNKFLAITSKGYDEMYVLPGNALAVENNKGLSDDLVGASKAKLKSAFGKAMSGKIESRQLLNKFVKLVA